MVNGMNENLKRMLNETDEQYFCRICSMKESLGFTWMQMAEIFNDEFGCSMDNTTYRKRWAARKSAIEVDENDMHVKNNHLEEIKQAKHELEKERQKLYATKVEASRNLRQESRIELFYENIKSAIEVLPMPNIVVNSESSSRRNNKTYLLGIADIQAGANFDIPNNKYSLSICEERFNKLLNCVAQYILDNNIFRLNVVGLGDTVQGILRLTDLKLNETSVVEATISIARMIACFLNQLSAFCRIDYYHVPSSNHGQTRPIGSKASELASEDMEYVIGNYIHDVLRENERVVVHLNYGCDYIDIPVFNFNVTAMHGHTIKNLDTALRDMSATRRKLIDYLVLGHYHNAKTIPGNEHDSHDTEVLMCPSFQGTDPYAFYKLGKSSKAACKMFIFDKKRGCTGTEKFILN